MFVALGVPGGQPLPNFQMCQSLFVAHFQRRGKAEPLGPRPQGGFPLSAQPEGQAFAAARSRAAQGQGPR